MPIDMSAATVKAPQRKTTGSRTAVAPAKPVDYRSPVEKRTEGLNGLGQLAQGLLLMTGQYADAAAVGMHLGGIATEVAKIADSNETVAKPVDFLIEVGPYGALIQATVPFVLQILANHKVIKADALMGSNVVPPDVLDAQMKAQIMRTQALAMREQQAALAEAQAAQREMAEMMAAHQNSSQPAPA